MNWLKVAVCKVRCHLADPLLLGQRCFWQIFPVRFHLQTQYVFTANLHQLLRLGNVLSRVNDEKGNAEKYVLQFLYCLGKLATSGELIARLQSLYKIREVNTGRG